MCSSSDPFFSRLRPPFIYEPPRIFVLSQFDLVIRAKLNGLRNWTEYSDNEAELVAPSYVRFFSKARVLSWWRQVAFSLANLVGWVPNLMAIVKRCNPSSTVSPPPSRSPVRDAADLKWTCENGTGKWRIRSMIAALEPTRVNYDNYDFLSLSSGFMRVINDKSE